MPRTRLILIVLALALPVAAFGSLAVAAGGSGDRIAHGVTVDGVPVGDLSAEEARQRLVDRVQKPAQRPVEVTVAGRSFELSAREAGIRMDVTGAVAEAQRAGEEGGIFARGWRELTGGEIDRDVALTVDADAAAVKTFVGEIRDQLGRGAKDATLDISLTSVDVQKGKKGRRLAGADELQRKITGAIDDPDGQREFKAETESIQPKVTEDNVFDSQPVAVTVSKGERKVRFFRRGEMVKSYSVAIGSEEYPTPPGQFVVQTKQVDPVWSVPNSSWAAELAGQTIPAGDPRNPLLERWIGINGSVGFHGSSSTGSGAQSHGCIRMVPSDVIDLYERVETGTPVLVA